jgi:hypothetical protein
MAEDLRNNENRARFKNDSVNPMTPRFADGSIAGGMRFDPNSVPGNSMPPPIRGDAAISADPHRHGRNSFDNLANKPGEATRAERSGETRRRLIESRTPTYKYK